MNKIDLQFRPGQTNKFYDLLDVSMSVRSMRPADEFFERWNHGVLMTALFLFGMVFGVTIADGFAVNGWLAQYQATIAITVATGIALFSVGRIWRAAQAQIAQNRVATAVSLFGREEERIDAALPGLREAVGLFAPLARSLSSQQHLPEAVTILSGALGQAPYLLQLERLLPRTADAVRRNLSDKLANIAESSDQLRVAEQQLALGQKELGRPDHWSPAEYHELQDEVATVQHIKRKLENQLRREIEELNATVMAIDNKIRDHEKRLAAIRQEIDKCVADILAATTRMP